MSVPLIVPLAIALCLTAVPMRAQDATLETVLARSAEYVTALAASFASMVAEERSEQSASGGPMAMVTERRIGADILVVRVPGTDQWMGFRDVFEVNRNRVRDREDRLLRLFVDSPATAVAQAKRLADESARYNVGDLTRNFNLPTTALFMLMPATQSRFEFRKVGERTRDRIRYWVVRGREVGRPTLVQTSMGHDAELFVEYLIEPSTGRVATTEMRLKYPAVTIITVEYRPDEKLGHWVPARMDESYEQGQSRIRSEATYSNFRRFQVNTDTAFRHD